MITALSLYALQCYWWVLVSVLGAILVFLLFVQGGQSMLLFTSPQKRDLIVSIFGRKWELTFTTLVTFGGAAFAAFPLFYSTSFGGAYWLWMLILLSFVLQAVSYEFRSKPGNLFTSRTYDIFLFINGFVGCVILGVAVAMFFFGGEFTVTRTNLLDASAPVISSWAPTHGFEAIFNIRNLLLGFAVFFLARTMAAIYIIGSVEKEAEFDRVMRRSVIVNGVVFLVFFLTFLAVLLTADGYTMTADGTVTVTPYKYLDNYLTLWWALVALLAGAVLVIIGIAGTAFSRNFKGGNWYFALGTVLAVLSLFWVAGFNDTPFYPSLTDAASSLTIRNASSSHFTLTVMAYASLVIPVVLAYVAYVWRVLAKGKMNPSAPAETH